MRHGTDHHSFVLFNKRVREARDKLRRFAPGVVINQISWQVGSLARSSTAATGPGRGLQIQRSGRDMPGSNWHTYFYDPDGHTNELYYGMEQIGWDWHSKPDPMHDRGFREKPELPQMNEQMTKSRRRSARGDRHPLGLGASAIALPADLRRRRHHVAAAVQSHRASARSACSCKTSTRRRAFYQPDDGLRVTEEATWKGQRCVFLRANTEHHSIALYPIELRETLGLRDDSTTFAVGFQVGTYRQLRDARTFLTERGARSVEIPADCIRESTTRSRLDPDGRLQLYFTMEQIGWDGAPPGRARPRVDAGAWPATLAGDPDVYGGETLLGPLG